MESLTLALVSQPRGLRQAVGLTKRCEQRSHPTWAGGDSAACVHEDRQGHEDFGASDDRLEAMKDNSAKYVLYAHMRCC